MKKTKQTKILTKLKNLNKYFVNKNIYIILILVGFIFFLKTCSPTPTQSTVQTVDNPLTLQELETYKGKYNKIIYQFQQVSLEKDKFKAAVDSLSRIAKIKPRKVNSITTIASAIDTSLKSQLNNISYSPCDSTNKCVDQADLVYKDSHNNITAHFDLKDSTKSLISLDIKDSLVILYNTESKLFKKPVSKVNVFNSNSLVKFTGANSISKKIKPNPISVGINISFSPIQYNLNKSKITFDQLISAGIGVSIHL